ncbi:hypothetical protein DSLASN_27760 [Desulfoluna limicola]|uniref:PilY1 beta-propeller domain-containing protein n=1 Tax=Desulfoluna limicola TaxID=2810562 RepID=A0ABM7PIS1_9BACT|nr:PilC/PilY family type IV pilus protein [Desulfoluna limicola]BCS97144.1 hypothetical protein DSLASN_27760 [Desulfoluna limicola]
MGNHTHPIHATGRSLPFAPRLAGLALLCLISLFILGPVPSAHGVGLPYNENFNYPKNSGLPSEWLIQDQDNTEESYHNIRKKNHPPKNDLRIVSGGDDPLKHYYTVYLDEITGNFAATIQITGLDNTTSSTKAGLIVQNNLGTDANNKAHIQVAVNRTSGYMMLFDDNGDGTADQSFTREATVAPPNVWLKLIRSDNTFTGFYSTDGTTWETLGTVASTMAESDLNVGLFGYSGQKSWWLWNRKSTSYFDNFTLTDDAATYVYYQDSDGDTYGDSSTSIVTSTDTAPSGYVDDNTDCDDTDATIHPGATELCDGKDNNCDGDTDEGLSTITYYWDGDGDGYGTITNTRQGCTSTGVDNWVTQGGDCNDNNYLINPGAADICGNNINEDCAGGDAVCFSDTICETISDIPLSVTIGGSPAIIMFILDDSGSMEWSVMCAEDEGRFNGLDEYTDNYSRPRWKSQYHGYNRIYYNPGTTYEPWPDSQSYTFTDADFASVAKHPMGFPSEALKNENHGSSTISLTREFDTIDGKTITFGHYYVTSTVDSQPYLIDLGSDSSGPAYYRVTQSRGDSEDHYRTVDSLASITPAEAAQKKVAIGSTFAIAKTNFANWFTYHRTRETATKAALALALQDLSGIKVGIHTLNHSVIRPATPINSETDVKAFLDHVYDVDRDGPTPMKLALEAVGQYFDATDGGLHGGIGDGTSPFSLSTDGGNCQQAFAILMTDGYGNGGAPRNEVGNADGDNNSDWDGTGTDGENATSSEFYGKDSKRLPDIAMYYYERDLVTTLDNEVPVQDPDYEATHQRMVTYTVAFGVQGENDPADYPDCPPSHPDNPLNCPTWPSGGTNEVKVDELWHAAVNGRGKYINTGSPQELSDAINTVLNDITRRTGTAASVAVSSEKLDTGLVIYQGYFDSGDWSGNLEAYNVDSDGVVDLTPEWSAKTQLDAVGWGDRIIFTKNDSTGDTTPFRTRSSLSAAQGGYLTQDQLDYIRGDNSNEIEFSGPFRNRTSKLGDITHSSPILHKGHVYVGANDGMFHAFDADNGNEVFAYVPTFVYPNLAEYSSPNYVHKFYADGTATAKTVGSSDWVVSGLRKGGRGLFGINVTSFETLAEGTPPAIWEYPTQAVPDDDMGYTYGEVTIAEGNDSSAGGQLIFAANGYDSPNGRAVLLILRVDPASGQQRLFKKIDTGVGSSTPGNCNGLSDPLVVDINDDGKADSVYAGDLLGNLWKFDVSSTSRTDWDVAYKTSDVSKPLFSAKNSTGQIQPITSKPSAMFHCDATHKGIIVVFGTGRMLSETDLDNTNTQTIYGIWDWQKEWDLNNGSSDAMAYHMGTFNTPSGTPALRTLSNIDGNSLFPANVNLTLLQQTEESSSDAWRYTSNNAIDWFSPATYLGLAAGASYTGGTHIGWYLDLPDEKERVITKTQIRDSKAYVVSIIPEPAPCASGGTTVGSILSACNGGQLDDPQWDTDGQNGVTSEDDNPSGKKFGDDIYYAPAIIEDKLFFTKDRVEDTTDEVRGLFYWRIRD